ncbi:uncharacterized protein EI97DRAFT_357069, partial [Westerdykella ornata]
EENQFHSLFPNPPPFWKSFTAENLARLDEIKKGAQGGAQDGNADMSTIQNAATETSTTQLSAAQLLTLPAELRYLVPPAPPAEDSEYRVFNIPTRIRGMDLFQKNLESMKRDMEQTGLFPGWEYEQLFPSRPPSSDNGASEWTLDRQQYLLRFLRSILLNFLELLGILATNPASDDGEQKMKDILTLVANVHALVNEYRPHQARETLILMMQDQVERKKAEIEAVRQVKGKVAAALAELERSAPGREAGVLREDEVVVEPEEKRREMQRRMWYAMDELL